MTVIFKRYKLNPSRRADKMKKVLMIFAMCLALAACNSKQKNDAAADEQDTSMVSNDRPIIQNPAVSADTIIWEKVPELKGIGAFPFFIPTGELAASDAKDGVSELIEYAQLNNYTGTGIYPAKGKLALLSFQEQNGKPFNKLFFDDTFDGWIEKLGAALIYEGPFPADEAAKTKLKENLYNGKKRTFALGDDEPFAVYAFRNEGKKYIIHVQSNSAEGQVYVMELK